MIIENAKHEITAVSPKQYPDTTVPEVAFVGRSNVGKSSLINTLLNRKNLARVGGTPGKTRQINFYNIDDCMFFVDLPGYGYAKVSKSEKASWGQLADTYLTTRGQLKLIVLLIDIRHNPTQHDKLMQQWIVSMGIPYVIAATKSDKLKRSQIKPSVQNIKKNLNIGEDVEVIPFSSTKRQGKEELWNEIKSFCDVE